MQRVLVIGNPGSGKSTLAIKLSRLTGLPVFHLDKLFWKSGWVMMDDAEWIPRLQRVLERPRWIIDGSYTGTLAIRLAKADTVIHLDFPRWRCLWRIHKRILQSRGRVRPDMAEWCPERFDWEFVKWTWNYRKRHRPLIISMLKQHQNSIEIVSVTGPAAVRQLVRRLSTG